MSEHLTNQLKSCKIFNAPSMNHLPMDVINKIIDKLGPKTLLVLRKVCRNLRKCIDNIDPGWKLIHVSINRKCIDLTLCKNRLRVFCWQYDERFSISYRNNGSGCFVRLNDGVEKFIEKAALDAMLDDVGILLKNPKIQLDSLEIRAKGCQKTVVKWFKEIIQSGNQIPCKSILLHTFGLCEIISMLSYFKSGVLELIDVRLTAKSRNIYESLALTESEQWQGAKKIKLLGDSYIDFPIEHLFHLSEFKIQRDQLSVADAVKIRDILMKSAHFQYGTFFLKVEFNAKIVKVFNPKLKAHTISSEVEVNLDQFCLYFAYHGKYVRIERPNYRETI